MPNPGAIVGVRNGGMSDGECLSALPLTSTIALVSIEASVAKYMIALWTHELLTSRTG
jgi:hypothetical protein